MLSTGIRTPVGVKVIGTDLVEIDRLARQVEQVLKTVPGTSSAYAERGIGGYYLDVTPDRAALARYGLMVQDVQDVIATALGGQTVTTTVEGRQRFGVTMRYPRDLRDNPQAIASDVLVPMPGGGAVPLGEVATITPARGPTSIRTENGQLATYIYVDIRDRDLGGYVADAQQAVQASVRFPPGTYVVWSGQYEYLERAAARLRIVVPVTLLIIFLLLYLNFRSITETMIVMLSLPFALVGGLWLMWWLGFNLSVAVAVGFIALAGVAAETGVVMLIYLNQALAAITAQRDAAGRALTQTDLYDAVMEGAVERVRPKMMTVVAIMAGPVSYTHLDVYKRQAQDRGRAGLSRRAGQRRYRFRRGRRCRGGRATGRSQDQVLPQPDGAARYLADAEKGRDGDGLHPRLRRRRQRRRFGEAVAGKDPAHRRPVRGGDAARHPHADPGARHDRAR